MAPSMVGSGLHPRRYCEAIIFYGTSSRPPRWRSATDSTWRPPVPTNVTAFGPDSCGSHAVSPDSGKNSRPCPSADSSPWGRSGSSALIRPVSSWSTVASRTTGLRGARTSMWYARLTPVRRGARPRRSGWHRVRNPERLGTCDTHRSDGTRGRRCAAATMARQLPQCRLAPLGTGERRADARHHGRFAAHSRNSALQRVSHTGTMRCDAMSQTRQ